MTPSHDTPGGEAAAPGAKAITHRDPHSPRHVKLGAELYKDLTMGSDLLEHLLPHTANPALKSDIAAEVTRYRKAEAQVKSLLLSYGETPKPESAMTRLSARAGLWMNTALDSTDSHIAGILMEGCTMTITEMTKLDHEYREYPECAPLLSIAATLAQSEEKHLEIVKTFL